MKWFDKQDGCLITHNRMFSGCEATTAILVSKYRDDPGLRSGLLRGVARLVLVGDKYGYEKKKLMQDFDVIEI